MKIHTCQQGTQEWLDIKRGRLSASDANTIAANGKGLKTLCMQKASELIAKELEESYTNADMERGNLLESEARESYSLDKGVVVEQVGFVEMNAYVGCSPDGLVGDDGLVEIKCPNNRKFTQFLFDGKIEKKYLYQMQMQMLVCERDWCDYVIYNPNFDQLNVITRVEADKKIQEKIQKGLETGVKIIKEIIERING